MHTTFSGRHLPRVARRQGRSQCPPGQARSKGSSMGFSLRVAPGIRIRASSRGLRTSIGPRAARLHFGAGRAGMSTGIGPVGYYTSIGGSPRRRSGGSTGAASYALTAVAKADQAQHVQAALDRVLNIQRRPFRQPDRVKRRCRQSPTCVNSPRATEREPSRASASSDGRNGLPRSGEPWRPLRLSTGHGASRRGSTSSNTNTPWIRPGKI